MSEDERQDTTLDLRRFTASDMDNTYLNIDSIIRATEAKQKLYKPQIESKSDYKKLVNELEKIFNKFKDSKLNFDKEDVISKATIKYNFDIPTPKKNNRK
jgi:ribonuclease HI